MRAVRFVRPQNRLRSLLSEPGGRTIPEAVQRATENVASVKAATQTEIDRSLALMRNAVELASCSAAQRERLYSLANVVAGLAGSCDLGDVGAVAFSLCDVVDRSEEEGRWDDEVVKLHVSAMSALRVHAIAGSEACRRRVLEGLNAVVQRRRAGAH